MKNIRLGTRGLILVGFPIVCQIVFMAVLAPILWNLQSSTLESCESRQLVVDMHSFLVGAVEKLQDMGLGVRDVRWATQNEVSGALIRLNEGALNSILERVATLLGRNDPLIQRVVNTEHQFEDAVFALTSANSHPFLSSHATAGDMNRIQSATNAFIRDWGELASKVTLQQEQLPEHFKDNARTLSIALIVTLAANIVVALGLWLLFTSTITRPLKTLVENSHRLARGEELLPELQLSDEIGDFDAVLHAASKTYLATLQREKAIVDRAAAMIMVINEAGLIAEANGYSLKLLGVPQEEMSGRAVEDFVVAEEILKANTAINDARRSREATTFQLRLTRVDGAIVDTRWSSFKTKGRTDLFCVVQDVTAEKNIERMKQDFIDMVSRDLSVPLASILDTLHQIPGAGKAGETQQAAQEPLPEPAAKEIRSMIDSISILVAFIDNLLDFQKMQKSLALSLGRVQLETLIEEAATLVRSSIISKGLTLSLPSGRYTLVCDRNKVLQTITNLLVNAIKYSPTRGKISLDVVETQDKLNVFIIDEGPGVPAEYRDKIFSPFEQMPNSREGIGLGLAICKLNIEAHGGTIGVKSGGAPFSESHRKGTEQGSSFWFSLPKALREQPKRT